MTTRYCAFCEDPIEPGEEVTIKEHDDPYDRVEGNVAHDECLRRHRAAVDQTRRMFETKPKGPWHSVPIEDIDEDALDAELNELEVELEDELNDGDK